MSDDPDQIVECQLCDPPAEMRLDQLVRHLWATVHSGKQETEG